MQMQCRKQAKHFIQWNKKILFLKQNFFTQHTPDREKTAHLHIDERNRLQIKVKSGINNQLQEGTFLDHRHSFEYKKVSPINEPSNGNPFPVQIKSIHHLPSS